MDQNRFYLQNAEHGLNEEEIKVAAYFVWQRDGEPDGHQQEQHWATAVQELLLARIKLLEATLRIAQPQNLLDVWNQLRSARHAIQVATEHNLKVSLSDRPLGGRDQAADDKTLSPLSDTINRAIELGDYRLAAASFRDGYATVRDYENEKGNEIHKGALAFDVARAYLQSWDFFAAMHYFELAEFETQATGNPNFSVYTFDLFEKNFWDAIQIDTTTHPIPIYQELWSKPYDKASALEDYSNLADDSKLTYIIVSATRIRLQNIADHSGWDASDGLRLGYWSLASDIARLLEVETKRRFTTRRGAAPADSLMACLEQGFQNTAIGAISREISLTIPAVFPRIDNTGLKKPKQLYEENFDSLLTVIRDTSKPPFERICHSLYLLGFTRNQVAHRLDNSSKLFMQLDDARFLVDLFLTLCRTDEWKGI